MEAGRAAAFPMETQGTDPATNFPQQSEERTFSIYQTPTSGGSSTIIIDPSDPWEWQLDLEESEPGSPIYHTDSTEPTFFTPLETNPNDLWMDIEDPPEAQPQAQSDPAKLSAAAKGKTVCGVDLDEASRKGASPSLIRVTATCTPLPRVESGSSEDFDLRAAIVASLNDQLGQTARSPGEPRVDDESDPGRAESSAAAPERRLRRKAAAADRSAEEHEQEGWAGVSQRDTKVRRTESNGRLEIQARASQDGMDVDVDMTVSNGQQTPEEESNTHLPRLWSATFSDYISELQVLLHSTGLVECKDPMSVLEGTEAEWQLETAREAAVERRFFTF